MCILISFCSNRKLFVKKSVRSSDRVELEWEGLGDTFVKKEMHDELFSTHSSSVENKFFKLNLLDWEIRCRRRLKILFMVSIRYLGTGT